MYGIESEKKYNDLRKNNLDWQGNDTSVNGKELFEKVTKPVQEYVDKITVRLDTSSENGSSIMYNASNMKSSLFTEYGHRKYGRCFSYQPSQDLLALGIYYIKIEL